MPTLRADYAAYDIYRRTKDGRQKIARIEGTDPKIVAFSVIAWIKGAYKEEGIEPPACDADRLFFAEPDPASHVDHFPVREDGFDIADARAYLPPPPLPPPHRPPDEERESNTGRQAVDVGDNATSDEGRFGFLWRLFCLVMALLRLPWPSRRHLG